MKLSRIIKWEFRFFAWFMIIFLIVYIIGIYSEHKMDTKGQRIPFTYYDIENEKYTTIQMILEDSGFKNIVVDFVETDSSEMNGHIKSFNVDNSNSFSTDDYYSEDVPIIITAYKLSRD